MAKKNLVGKIAPEIFRKGNMDIRDSNEVFGERGIDIKGYESSHVSASVSGEGRVYDVEMELAETAMKEGYKVVTNMDYLSLRGATAIAARGWKLR